MWNVNDAAINALRTLNISQTCQQSNPDEHRMFTLLQFYRFPLFFFSFFFFFARAANNTSNNDGIEWSFKTLARVLHNCRKKNGERNGRISGSQCLTNSNPQAIKFSRSVTLSSLSSEIRGILEFIEPIPDTKKIKQIDAAKSRFISRVRNYLIIEMPARVQIRFRVAFECGTKETNNY